MQDLKFLLYELKQFVSYNKKIMNGQSFFFYYRIFGQKQSFGDGVLNVCHLGLIYIFFVS